MTQIHWPGAVDVARVGSGFLAPGTPVARSHGVLLHYCGTHVMWLCRVDASTCLCHRDANALRCCGVCCAPIEVPWRCCAVAPTCATAMVALKSALAGWSTDVPRGAEALICWGTVGLAQ